MTIRPCSLRKETVSRIIARFSSRVVRSTSRTWRSQLLPNTATHRVPAERRAAQPSSSLAEPPFFRVEPKATRWVSPNTSSPARRKNSMSLGLEPGFPASTKAMPSLHSFWAMFSLSSREKLMPSPWAPSRRVVSNISMLLGSMGALLFCGHIGRRFLSSLSTIQARRFSRPASVLASK